MDRTRLFAGDCARVPSDETRLLQPRRPMERRPASGMGVRAVRPRELALPLNLWR